MASSKIKGITVEIGGDTTKLGKAIADTEKQSRSLQGELKQVEKLLKFDPGNTELLAQKQKILTDAVKETTDKLEILRKAEAQVIDQFNKGDIGEDQLRAFQREVIKTQSELDDFESKLKNTGDSIEDLGDSAESSSDGFTIMGGALADLTASAISGAIGAIGDFIGSLMELSEATEEYRTMQAKLEGSANTFGYSIDFANSKYKEFYKYIGDDQASTNAITNLMGLGTSTESVTALAEGAIGVWSAYGDSIPIEGLTEALNETAQVGKVTGSLADALNWAGISEDKFNEKLEKCKNTQERADLIAKTLNDTYGESKKTYDDLNKSVTDTNEAELELKETQAQLGEAVAPVNNAITDMKNQALQAITPLVEKLADGFMKLYEWLQKNPTAMTIITALAIALASAFTVLAGALAIQGIISGVTKAIAFLNTTLLANPIVLIIAGITALVTAFIYLWNNCDAFREFWINLWKKIKEVASSVKDALVQFFTVTIPNAWNKFKTFTSNLITNVVKYFKELPGKIWDAIVKAYERVTTWGNNIKTRFTTVAKNAVNAVITWFKQLPGKIWDAIVGAYSKITTWGSNMATKGKEAMSKMSTSIIDKVKEIPGKIKSVAGDIVTGLWNGINNKVSWLKNKISGFVGNVTGWLKKFFKIESPSKVMRDEIGKYIAEGIGEGITDNSDKPIGALNDLGDEMINGATLNRKLTTTFTSGAVGSAGDNGLLAKLDGIYERLGRLQIVLDTGTLVGETIDKIDRGLATRQTLSARGV